MHGIISSILVKKTGKIFWWSLYNMTQYDLIKDKV